MRPISILKRIKPAILSLFLFSFLLAEETLAQVRREKQASQEAAASSAAGPSSEMQVLRAGGKVKVLENGKTVLAYQQSTTTSEKNTHPRAHYVHPLISLDGDVITEDFPADHLHHRGIFWAWHQVLVDDEQAGDAWLCRNFQWRTTVNSIETTGEKAIIDATAIWTSDDIKGDDGQPIQIATDNVRIEIHSVVNGYRVVDYRIEIAALVNQLRIGGSDDAKGYGGFSPRIKLNDDQHFIGPKGEVEPIVTAVEAGPWIAIVDTKRGIAFAAHPDNPEPNQSWILRRKGSMQSAAYPGREAVPVSKGSPLILRYRTILFGANSLDEIRSLVGNELDRFSKTD